MMQSASSGRLELRTEMRETEAGEIAVVSASGEVDLSNAEELAAALRAEAVRASAGIVLDLRAVPFMDSSGLRVLLIMSGDEHGEGAPPFAVALGPGSPVMRLLELAEVSGRLELHESVEAAVVALAGASQ